MATFNAGVDLNAVPAPVKQALSGNYLDFHSGAAAGWAQQHLPELYEKEVERYGNRSVASFLRMVGAELPMTSDQVIWSEQGRLHLAYEGATVVGTDSTNLGDNLTVTGHAIRVGQTVVISDGTNTAKAYVHYTATNQVNVKTYAAADLLAAGIADNATVKLFVYGSEFSKGTAGMNGAVEPSFKSFTNKPIIIKDKYEVSGSDASQIGWIEIAGEGGQSGYMWYLKGEGDTRVRFEDYLEMAMVEGELAATSSGASGTVEGTEGLFAAITKRGHKMSGGFSGNTASALSDFDEVLKKFDKQGAIEENMLFLDRESALNIDDMVASLNAGYNGGTSYGVFNNSENMALNLGFSGFRRGSYDFYKTDWKYLNDASTRGLIDDVNGVIVPAGTSSVYDQNMGKNIKRPFLHVRYRASQADDRRMKSWITGSVGGNITSDLDALEVHYLSERCLVVQGANNFMLLV